MERAITYGFVWMAVVVVAVVVVAVVVVGTVTVMRSILTLVDVVVVE